MGNESGVRFEVWCQLLKMSVQQTGNNQMDPSSLTLHIWGVQEDVPEMIPHPMAVGLPRGF